MRILLIKTSSMGDLIHTLPALTDAGKAMPGIRFDWVVEKSFSEIPAWHPLVDNVIPVSLREWRKRPFSSSTWKGLQAYRRAVRKQQYDLILDAQGLVKSAFLTRLSKGRRCGLDRESARESLAAFAYQQHCTVNFYQHAVVRMRSLFSQAFGYPLPDSAPDFGLSRQQFAENTFKEPYLVFLHGTTWASKQWPETYWVELAKKAAEAGYRIKISGGSQEEVDRAERIASQCDAVDVYPFLKITEMAVLLANAKGAAAVDTGFAHLAAAMNLPTVSIYGSTNPAYTGALGNHSIQLAADFPCSPCLNRECSYRKPSEVTPACYGTIPPERVWGELRAAVKTIK